MPLSAKLSLLGLWLIATITISVISVRHAVHNSTMDTAKVTHSELLPITETDTLRITMMASDLYDVPFGRSTDYHQRINTGTEDIAIYRNVRLIVRSTQDSTAIIRIYKKAKDLSYSIARDRAETIDYKYNLINNELQLDGFFIGKTGNTYTRNLRSEVEVVLYLPEGTTLIADDNTYTYHRNNSGDRDLLLNGTEEKYLTVKSGILTCATCPQKKQSSEWRSNDDSNWESTDDEWQQRSYEEGERAPDWNNAPDSPEVPKEPIPEPAPVTPVVSDSTTNAS